MPRIFKNANSKFVEGNFKSIKQKSPSPKRKDYEKRAVTKMNNKTIKCGYINPDNNVRCKLELGLYPKYCSLHTMLIENLYIEKSNIKNAGNGLFVGPYGFKKGDIIGKYSYPHNKVSLETLEKRCKKEKCWDYIFCDITNDKTQNNKKVKCWDGLDLRSTIIRNINDARNSKFRNNSYFEIINGDVYARASRNIKPFSEIFISYGSKYWN
mgnify:CR=1 FL=1